MTEVTTTTIDADLTCSGCGDSVSAIDPVTRQGPCCHNLPRPWRQNASGLYTSNQEYELPAQRIRRERREAARAGDEGLPCPDCGGHEILLVATQAIEVARDEEGDLVAYYESCEYDIHKVECSGCGRNRGADDIHIEHA